MQILTDFRSEIGWFFEHGNKDIYVVPFLLTCAAALECSLNDHLISHLSSIEGEHGKNQIPGFLSMTLKGKLINVVPILTQNKYVINTQHKAYQILTDLIKKRNKLTHNKSDYEEFEGTIDEDKNGIISIVLPEEINQKLDDITLGVGCNIGKYHDSLEKFHELFLEVYEKENFAGNDLIIKSNA